jgi:accessory Sec system glycosyltransferase GtfB
VLALFNSYDDATKELIQSLATADIDIVPVIIDYDGELPDGALCPIAVYTGIERKGDPLFFNEVPVPAWCEIRQGLEVYGEILRDGYPIGKINYDPNSFRQVQSVDWLLPDRTLGHTDHYDRYGNRYARTYYSNDVAYQTVYQGPGEWEIEVNHVSRVVTMRSMSSLLTFETLTDFVSYFIDDQRLADDRVLINSLSYPLFVMRRRAVEPNTTLFWQEPMPGDVPGNMATELEQPKALARIVFCDERLQQRVAARYRRGAVDLAYLSHLGQFLDNQGYHPRRAFTLTNTDQIPVLVELLEAFPDVTFSVAALTLMSPKLYDLGRRHANLILIPSINHTGIRAELDNASVYLDINAGAHVLEVVKAAYYLNLVVLALTPYAKAPDYARVFSTTEELKSYLAAVIISSEGRARALEELHTQRGPLSTPADYRRIFAQSQPSGQDRV